MLLFRSKKTLRKQRSSSSLNNLNTLPNISFAGTAVNCNFLIFVYFLKHNIKFTKHKLCWDSGKLQLFNSCLFSEA